MDWWTFYENFLDWSESTIKTRISSLEDIGSGDEIVEVILNIDNEKIRAQLIRKAIRMEAEFTSDDFMNLDGELPDDVYRQLAEYAGFDADDPYFDEDNMEWCDFYNCTHDWSRKALVRRISKLSDFGPNDEIVETILLMPDTETSDLLYKRAVECGVKFSSDEEFEIGNWGKAIEKSMPEEKYLIQLDNDLQIISNRLDADIAAIEKYKKQQKKAKKVSFWGAVLGILSGLGSGKNKSGSCDGNCANCPPHFGYRYGRWYYGHGHNYGCERGGNGGYTTGRD